MPPAHSLYWDLVDVNDRPGDHVRGSFYEDCWPSDAETDTKKDAKKTRRRYVCTERWTDGTIERLRSIGMLKKLSDLEDRGNDEANLDQLGWSSFRIALERGENVDQGRFEAIAMADWAYGWHSEYIYSERIRLLNGSWLAVLGLTKDDLDCVGRVLVGLPKSFEPIFNSIWSKCGPFRGVQVETFSHIWFKSELNQLSKEASRAAIEYALDIQDGENLTVDKDFLWHAKSEPLHCGAAVKLWLTYPTADEVDKDPLLRVELMKLNMDCGLD